MLDFHLLIEINKRMQNAFSTVILLVLSEIWTMIKTYSIFFLLFLQNRNGARTARS